MTVFLKKIRVLTLVTSILVLQGCATIPGETPELSTELGNRISAIETSHLDLLHKYFDEKRQKVDEFIATEWISYFAEQVFATPAIESIWSEIVRTNNKPDRLQFLIRTGPKLQAKINTKRLELMKPLDDAERVLESTLRKEYQQTRAINNSITSFLISASKTDKNRARYLEMIGVTDQKITSAMDSVDSAISTLLDKGKDIHDNQQRAKIYLEKVNSALKKLKN